MAIKTFTFSFKLDAKDLLEYVTERNVGVNIEAFGTEPKKPKQPKLLAAPAKLALPAPGGKLEPTQAVLLFILDPANTSHEITMKQVTQLLVKVGYSARTGHNLIWRMRENGFLKQYKRGTYRATAKAMKEVNHG